jgi:hypothetical protein
MNYAINRSQRSGSYDFILRNKRERGQTDLQVGRPVPARRPFPAGASSRRAVPKHQLKETPPPYPPPRSQRLGHYAARQPPAEKR